MSTWTEGWGDWTLMVKGHCDRPSVLLLVKVISQGLLEVMSLHMAKTSIGVKDELNPILRSEVTRTSQSLLVAITKEFMG